MKTLKYLGQGLLHYEKDLPCQDYIRTHTAENGNIILAVSDGCSSSEFAVEGAKINTQAVINIFTDTDISSLDAKETDLKKVLCEECLRLIDEDYSSKQETEPDKHFERESLYPEYSATLLFAVINTNQNKAVIGHIGDGLVVCTDKEGNIQYISDAENINNQSNMTYFITSYNAEEHLRIDSIELGEIENVFLSSDGAYQMLLECGYNQDPNLEFFAGTIAAQITRMVSTEEIKTNADLVSLLDRLCFYPLLRKDDWAIVIWNKSNEPESENRENDELTPVIMMNVEKAKSRDYSLESDDNSDENSSEELIGKSDKKPIEASNEKTVEDSNEKPVENSDEKTVEDSNEKPVENSDEKPIEDANEKPVENSDEKPIEDANEKPIEDANEKSVENSNEKSVEDSNEKSVEDSNEKSVEDSNEKSVEDLDKEPVGNFNEGPLENSDEKPIEDSDKEPVKNSNKKIENKRTVYVHIKKCFVFLKNTILKIKFIRISFFDADK